MARPGPGCEGIRPMETKIESLGAAQFRSPLHHIGSSSVNFRTDADRVLMDDTYSDARGILNVTDRISFEIVGPPASNLLRPTPHDGGWRHPNRLAHQGFGGRRRVTLARGVARMNVSP